MPDSSSRHAVAVSVLLSLALVGATLACFDPFFATNDDAVMAMIASGTGLSLRPDEHLVFTNVLVGRPLAALYRGSANVPWYGLYLVGVQAAAWTALFSAVLARGVTARRVLLCALTFGVVGLGFLVNLQFTSTAFLAGTAGGCLWTPRGAGPEGTAQEVAAVLLMVAGSLVRFDAFLLAFSLAGLAGALAPSHRGRWRWLAIGLVTLVLAAAAHGYDRHVYRRDAGWSAFREFIPLLPEVMDYGRADVLDAGLAPVLAQVAWSENDHRLFMQWFHADPDVFSVEAVRRLLSSDPPTAHAPDRLRNGARRLGRVVRNPAAWAMLCALPCLVLESAYDRRRRLLMVAAALAAALLMTLLLAAFRKAPPHVYLPLLSFSLCLALVTGASSAPARGGRVLRAAIVLLALAGLVRSITLQRAEGRVERDRSRSAWRQFTPLTGSSARLVVAWFQSFPFEIVRPLEPQTRLDRLRLFSLSWPQRTPVARDLLLSFGSADLLDVLPSPRTVFLGPPGATGLLARYAEEHRGLRMTFAPDPELTDLSAFRARIVPAPGARP